MVMLYFNLDAVFKAIGKNEVFIELSANKTGNNRSFHE